jgi:uncharacterized membrane protein YdjX (TVP38/TMEM64 family)
MKTKITITTLLLASFLAILFWIPSEVFSLSYIQSQKQILTQQLQDSPYLFPMSFAVIYTILCGLSIPAAATLLTLLGGALFGFELGVFIISFASTVGATLAFWSSRYILQDWVKTKFNKTYTKLSSNFEKNGISYVFTLRIAPVFPFFLVNLLLGLTPIKTWKYYIASQIGMLPGTLIYVNAGTQLGQLKSLSGIMSPSALISFLALGLLPYLSKYASRYIATFGQKNRA